MTRKYGVSSTGLIAPIIREGDNLAEIVTETVLNSGIKIDDNDVIGITESIVARAEGNYVTVDEIAEEVKRVMGKVDWITLYNPIFSRNRFSMILKGIARAVIKGVNICMDSQDEVGNVYRYHPFTGINYDEYYKSIVENEGKGCYIKYPNNFIDIDPKYTIDCSLRPEFIRGDYTLMSFFRDKCDWGLLGSNKASEEKIKLFPSKKYSTHLVEQVQRNIIGAVGKIVQVMVYGDGCFKDPIGGIWEFADPVVSPAYTKGLEGSPNELKLKNLADEKFSKLNGASLEIAIHNEISRKDNNLKGSMLSQGTTPRRYVDLLGSLMDLTSGSGDKGTPVVYIKNYFKNYSED
jgi:hypothetical protein